MSGSPLEFTLELAAPRPRVFAALTEARHLSHWFCDEAESDPRAGGVMTLRWTRASASAHPFVARWQEWAPPERASFEGGHPGYPGGSAGVVTFRLEALATGGTRLTVTHTTDAGAEFEPFAAGWRAAWPRALDRLARYLSPGTVEAGA